MTETDIALLSILVAVLALLWQGVLLRRRLTLQTYGDYNKRYYEIMSALPIDVFDADYVIPEGEEGERILRVLRSYFFLCEEEEYAWRRGWIDRTTWRMWRNGIETALSRPGIRQGWLAMREYDGFSARTTRWFDGLTAATSAGLETPPAPPSDNKRLAPARPAAAPENPPRPS